MIGWLMLIGGGVIAVIPGMFQVANGATVWGILLAVSGAVILLTNESRNV